MTISMNTYSTYLFEMLEKTGRKVASRDVRAGDFICDYSGDFLGICANVNEEFFVVYKINKKGDQKE